MGDGPAASFDTRIGFQSQWQAMKGTGLVQYPMAVRRDYPTRPNLSGSS